MLLIPNAFGGKQYTPIDEPGAGKPEVILPAMPEYPKSLHPYTGRSQIIGLPDIDPVQIINRVIKHKTKNYDADGIREIVMCYYDLSTRIGVDWILALAQNIHETAWLGSWWSAPPRRNPAGIGVSGHLSRKAPGGKGWVWNEKTGRWHKGYSYESWDEAVLSHMGLLLNYVYKDHEMNDTQLQISEQAPGRKGYRGVAKTLIGLNGRWAVPGKTYGQKIAAVANYLLK